mmetsp:Transcript_30471/g.50478  ORF Transcript_30471/g.50478 Transcript_30471/m.50478 type:complete len:201 (-) Transcript_30471:191-793(-)
MTVVLAVLSCGIAFSHGPSRVIVKNIAWEANEASLLNVFSQFGVVETVELKRGHKRAHARPHIGCAHVCFSKATEAQMAASSSIMLHGRSLSVRLLANGRSEGSSMRLRNQIFTDKAAAVESDQRAKLERAALLQRLILSSEMREVQSCADALGQFTATEYAIVKAAWKRAACARVKKLKGAVHIERMNDEHHMEASLGI